MAASLTLYQVDAFTQQLFAGNPAAVLVLPGWPQDDWLLAVAEENNLSETAFLVAHEGPEYDYQLRWFTPAAEVDLCGHATLASAHVLFNHHQVDQDSLSFSTRSGVLKVSRKEHGVLAMDFPAAKLQEVAVPTTLMHGLGVTPLKVMKAYDYIAVLDSQQSVEQVKPDFQALSQLDGRGVLITAAGDTCDFVSRCFFPKLKVPEDPVTGSAHCELAPFWAQTLGKSCLQAQQLSARGGAIDCLVHDERVELCGYAVTYLSGQIEASF